MATRVVAFDGTRLNNADSSTNWEDYDGTMWSGSTEPDFVYQGTGSQSVKVSNTARGGPGYDDTGTVDYSTTTRVWLAKVIVTNYGALNNKGATGGILRMSSGGLSANNADYYVVGGDTYPVKGGWLIIPLDPNATASTGTATVTAIDGYAFSGEFGAASRAPNIAMDAIDYVDLGSGMTVTRGDGTSPVASFQDFIDYDEGATATDGGRYGVVATLDGIIYTTGVLTIGGTGTAGVTEFTDSGQVMVFPEAEFISASGFFGIDIDLSNASTVVSISDSVFKSAGTAAGSADTRPIYSITGTSGTMTYDGCTFDIFNSFTATSSTTITDCIFNNGLLVTGTSGTWSGCSFSGQTTAANVAYFDIGTNIGNISDCSFDDSGGTGNAIQLSSTGTVTLDNIIFVGYGAGSTGDTVGPSLSANAAVRVTSASDVTLNIDGGTLPTVSVVNAITVTVAQDITVTVTVQDSSNNAIPGAFVQLFETGGTQIGTNQTTDQNGEASVTTNGAARNIIGIIRQSANTASFNASSGVNTGTDVITTDRNHKFHTGDAVLYDDNGGTQISDLTDGTTYYVNSITSNTLYLYDTATNAIAGGGTGRRNLTAGSSETHLLNPVRYINNSITIPIDGASVSASVTMVEDSIARDTAL